MPSLVFHEDCRLRQCESRRTAVTRMTGPPNHVDRLTGVCGEPVRAVDDDPYDTVRLLVGAAAVHLNKRNSLCPLVPLRPCLLGLPW